MSDTESLIQRSLDRLFDTDYDMSEWLPPKPPQVLGELLESRHMIPLILPSDPKFLCAVSRDLELETVTSRFPGVVHQGPITGNPTSKPLARYMRYRLRPCTLRSLTSKILTLVDGSQWVHRKRESELEQDYVHIQGKQPSEDLDDDVQFILNGGREKANLTDPVVRRSMRVASE
jgi:hypothetical protein